MKKQGSMQITFLIMLVIVLGAVIWYLLPNKPFFPTQLKSITELKTESSIIVLEENEWCKKQVLTIDEDREAPISNEILGFDPINECCLQEQRGYNCALHNMSTVQYCYTSMVGGTINYVKVNGYYQDTKNTKTYLDHLDKRFIQNKPCSIEVY